MAEAVAIKTAAHEQMNLQHIVDYDKLAVAIINAHPKKSKQIVILNSVFAVQDEDNVNVVVCTCVNDYSSSESDTDTSSGTSSSSSDGDSSDSSEMNTDSCKTEEKRKSGTKNTVAPTEATKDNSDK